MHNHTVVFALLVVITGCNIDDAGVPSVNLCKNPVEISNHEDATTFGFLVGVNQNMDVNVIATSLMDKYEDLEVFTVYSTCNCFHANSSSSTLSKLACESDIVSLQYNNASYTPASK